VLMKYVTDPGGEYLVLRLLVRGILSSPFCH
jgi:hypothetical protein